MMALQIIPEKLWRNIQTNKKGLSAGRVQSTLLSILKEHEDKIENFDKPQQLQILRKIVSIHLMVILV